MMRITNMLALLLLPVALTAQTVRGRVVDGSTTKPIVRAIVELSQGSWSVRTLTSASGVFSLEGRGPGEYFLRVAAIGFAPVRHDRLDLPDASLELGDIGLSSQVVSLEEIDVRANTSCKVNPNAATLLGRLLDGAHTSLEVMAATLPEMQAGFRVERILRRSIAATPDSVVTVDTLTTSFTAWPISSVGTDSLKRVGFSLPSTSDGMAGRTWFGPDVGVLFSDWFLAKHCFTVEAPDSRSGVVVVRYQPAKKLSRVDISGELRLDPRTLALTSLTFEHRNLPDGMRNGMAGGELDFSELPSGIWLPVRWSIHAPIQNSRGGVAGMLTQSGRVVGAGD